MNGTKEKIEKIALAALLHDIGKFWQRTSYEKPFDKQEQNYFNTYSHALWSDKFIEKFIGDSELMAWVRHHHDPNPQSIETKIIKLADWLASGERILLETVPESDEQIKRPYEARLENIFDNLTLNDKNLTEQKQQNKKYLPLTKYPDFSDFFPVDFSEAQKHNYDSLWESFIEDLKNFGWSDTQMLNLPFGTWLSLMKKYTSRIPSATPTKTMYAPDISLFQHSRITSAIASCLLFNYIAGTINDNDLDQIINLWKEINLNKDIDKSKEQQTPEIATFLCGDVSGIQEYIYSIPTKGAAKQLKARSFIIQLLCEFIATYICEQFSMLPCNIIYCSGGRFFILLPKGVNEKIKELAKKIAKELTDKLKGNLYLLIATTPVKLSHFLEGNFKEVWGNVTREVGKKKKQKYTEIVEERYTDIFEPLTREKFPVTSFSATSQLEEEDRDLQNFAKELRNANWIIRKRIDKIDKNNPEVLEFINGFGYDYEIFKNLEDKNLDNVIEIIALNSFDLEKKVIDKIRTKLDKIPINFRVFANYWPEHNNIPAQFEDLAKKSKGPEKIAIFRADVDNLGSIFKDGLKENNTLSRSAMLSSALSDFFEGYINYLAKEKICKCQENKNKYKYKENIGIVYSGGDDLFIVGSWDKVIDFAFELQDKFKKYTNHKLSFSGGIIVIDPTLPVRIAARMAENAENDAKNYKRNNGSQKEKDCIVIFDTPIGYEEKNILFDIKTNLMNIYNERENQRDIPFKGILRKLFDISAVYEKQKNLQRKLELQGLTSHQIKTRVILDRWKWLLAYSLRKHIKGDHNNNNDKDKWKECVLNIQRILLETDEDKIHFKIEDKLSAILRWVELLTRET